MRIATWGRGLLWVSQVLAVALIIQIGGFAPADVQAQAQVYCGFFGTCSAGTGATTFLGLPNGTLVVKSYHPWDRVVKGSAAADWEPLEVQARAFLSSTHGVANDERLPYAATDEIRALVFGELLGLARKEANGQVLSPVEARALATLKQAVVTRRVDAAQKAIEEYNRWQGNPCGYHVPPNFGFTDYNPGPVCLSGVPSTTGPPRPPTVQEFTAYGAALANQDFLNADAQAAFSRMQPAMLVAAGIASAVVASGVAAVLALTVPAVTIAFLGMMGSYATSYVAISAAGGALAGAATGVGVALSLPAIIILAVTVTVAGIIVVSEDAQILPTLQANLASAAQTPNIPAAIQNQQEAVNIHAAFVAQTLPDYQPERLSTFPPTPHTISDPQFDLNGAPQDLIEFKSADGLFRQVYMREGWFVTRDRTGVSAPWSPWYWTLSFQYIPANSGQARALGIQPGGFLDIDYTATPPTATRVTQFSTFLTDGSSPVITWKGNHAPVLLPTSNGVPSVGQAMTFTSGVSDPDGDAIQTVRWFFEDSSTGTGGPFTDMRACSFNQIPTGLTPPLPQNYVCPWTVVDDTGGGVQKAYIGSGRFNVRVIAMDARGATSSQQFVVNINPVTPALTVNPPVPSVIEGSPFTISGTLDYPGVNGVYDSAIRVFVDWGDGSVNAMEDFPCEIVIDPSTGLGVSGPICPAVSVNNGQPPYTYPGKAGPWTFSLTHTYTASATLPPVVPVRVWALAWTNNATTQTETFPVVVTNVAPSWRSQFKCVPFFCSPGFSVFDVAAGQTVTWNGWAEDIAGANLSAEVFWGDGTKTVTTLGTVTTSMTAGSRPGTYGVPASLSHAYANGGSYPISLVISDGGPAGTTTNTATATVYGIGPIQGQGAVDGSAPATFTYSYGAPAGTQFPTPTVSCGIGTLVTQSPGSFTCAFPDWPGLTVALLSVDVSVNGVPYTEQKLVLVRPIPLSLTSLTAPASIQALNPARFTVNYTKSQYATATLSSASCVGHIPTGFLPPVIDVAGTVSNVTPTSFDCAFPFWVTPFSGHASVTVTDSFGDSASTVVAVTVNPDTTGPVLSLPANIVVNSPGGGVPVTFTATANDAGTGPATASCSPASGSPFAPGVTTVTCSAADAFSNTSTGTFTVTVVVPTGVSVAVPAPIFSPTPVVTFSASALDLATNTPLTPTCVPASGSTFAEGATTVRCTATNGSGQTATGTFVVTVDSTAPTMTLPASIVANATSPSGTVVTFTATASDPDPAGGTIPVTPVCTPASGSTFAVGTTTVTCVATDVVGNAASGSFTVTVNSQSTASDVSAQVGITYGGFTLNRATGRWVQTLTLRNNGITTLGGPLSLVASGLSSNSALFQSSGTTTVFYAGSRYRNLAAASLAPGATASITLEFTKTGTAGITYTGKVIAGQGAR